MQALPATPGRRLPGCGRKAIGRNSRNSVRRAPALAVKRKREAADPLGVEKRRQQRAKKRLSCEIVVGGQRYPAIVRDTSPSSLFVQTRAKPEPNTVVELIFRAQGAHPEIRVEAGVARERVVSSQLQTAVPDGIGLELLDRPDGLEALLASTVGPEPVASESRPKTDGPSDRAIRSFRIKVTQRDAPNSRVLTVQCENPESARAQALARVGRGWKIVRIQEI